ARQRSVEWLTSNLGAQECGNLLDGDWRRVHSSAPEQDTRLLHRDVEARCHRQPVSPITRRTHSRCSGGTRVWTSAEVGRRTDVLRPGISSATDTPNASAIADSWWT